jgi:hypothetical protein
MVKSLYEVQVCAVAPPLTLMQQPACQSCKSIYQWLAPLFGAVMVKKTQNCKNRKLRKEPKPRLVA